METNSRGSGRKHFTPAGHAEIVDPEPHITWFAAFTTYLGYAVLIFLGRLRDLVGVWVGEKEAPAVAPKGMAPLIFPSENFYTRRLYYRVQEAFNRPIFGAPGSSINVVLRERKASDCLMHVKGPKKKGQADHNERDGGEEQACGGGGGGGGLAPETRRCLNLGSYNYLGFGDDWKATCGKDVLATLKQWPVGVRKWQTMKVACWSLVFVSYFHSSSAISLSLLNPTTPTRPEILYIYMKPVSSCLLSSAVFHHLFLIFATLLPIR